MPGDQRIEWRCGPSLPARRPRTLAQLIAMCLSAYGDRVVLRVGEAEASWLSLAVWSGNLAGHWQERVAPGDRVAILVGNGLAHLVAELAAWRLGAVAVPIFAGLGAERVRAALRLVEPRLAVVDSLGQALWCPPTCTAVTAAEVERLAASDAGAVDRPVAPHTPCLVLFTSGSSGAPRGVVLTHDNLCSQQAAFARLWPEVGVNDRLAAYLPWHHSFGALAERLWALCRGACLTVVPGGGRDRAQLLATIRAVRPTVFLSVPKIHRLLMAEDGIETACLRFAFTAGAALPDDVAAWYARREVTLYEGWGLTETSPCATIACTRPGQERVPGVVGMPIAGVAVGVRGDGHVLVRGPNVMAGYFRDDAATDACLAPGEPPGDGDDGAPVEAAADPDGLSALWPTVDSGDLGAWTPHGLRLDGRADRMLKLQSGEKVAAEAIEGALLAQPGVVHAVVAAEPDLLALIEAGEPAARAAVAAVNAAQELHYQRVAETWLIERPLTVEGGELTASLKVARGAVLAAFRAARAQAGGGFRRLE